MLWFLVSGSIGFLVDAGVVLVLTGLGWTPIWARLLSIPIAMSATFLINKNMTFKSEKNAKQTKSLSLQIITYIFANALSQVINFTAYSALVLSVPLFYQQPIWALAIGSIIAMGITFTLSKYWVFKERKNVE